MSAGLLSSLNRMNVMLTRCKQGMVLVTQRAFLRGPGKSTLLSRLAQRWERRVGEKAAWADAMEVADGRAALPGAPVEADIKQEERHARSGNKKHRSGRARRARREKKGAAVVMKGVVGLSAAG